MSSILLHPLPSVTPTAYLRGGATRTRQGDVPHIGHVLTVGRAPSKGWQLSAGTLAAYAALLAAWSDESGEPLRLVDAFRAPEVQQSARDGYEAWIRAGRPDPHSPLWRRGMKAAYVAPANGSNHQWGGAVDFDVGALAYQGMPRGSDGALTKLWEVALDLGWSPVIAHPIAEQSEAWHLDHLGPLRPVYEALASEYRNAYNETAAMGCALAGTLSNRTTQPQHRYVQARLSVSGFFCGVADGIVGPKTRAALKAADAPSNVMSKAKKSASTVIGWMNEAGLGVEEIAAL